MLKDNFKKYIYKIGIYPVRLYWYIFRPSRFGVKCIIEKEDGKILLIKNTYGNGKWNLPGGGIEKGETPENAVRREIQEEVGLELHTINFIGEFESTAEYKKDQINVFYSEVTNPILNIQESEISDYIWSDVHELPGPLSAIALKALNLQ